jgi:hypothetical protein
MFQRSPLALPVPLWQLTISNANLHFLAHSVKSRLQEESERPCLDAVCKLNPEFRSYPSCSGNSGEGGYDPPWPSVRLR